MSALQTGTATRAGGADAASGAAAFLKLAAAPTFAVMAVLTAVAGSVPHAMLCAAAPDALPLNGMALMYALMGAFHSAPWLRLVAERRDRLALRKVGSYSASC